MRKNSKHENELESNIATTSLLNQIKTIYHQDPDGGVYNLYIKILNIKPAAYIPQSDKGDISGLVFTLVVLKNNAM